MNLQVDESLLSTIKDEYMTSIIELPEITNSLTQSQETRMDIDKRPLVATCTENSIVDVKPDKLGIQVDHFGTNGNNTESGSQGLIGNTSAVFTGAHLYAAGDRAGQNKTFYPMTGPECGNIANEGISTGIDQNINKLPNQENSKKFQCSLLSRETPVSPDIEVREMLKFSALNDAKAEQKQTCSIPVNDKTEDKQSNKSEFSNESVQENHEKVPPISPTKPMNCRVCCEKFTKPSLLDRHYKNIHDLDEPYQCWRCCYRTCVYMCMERHMEFCGSSTPFPCEKCLEMFEGADVLLEHRVKAHSNSKESVEKVRCPDCSDEFENSEMFSLHSGEFHSKDLSEKSQHELLHCSECGDMFENAQHLSEHKGNMHSSDLKIPKTGLIGTSRRKQTKRKNSVDSGEANATKIKKLKLDGKVPVGIVKKCKKMPKLRLMVPKVKKVKSEPSDGRVEPKNKKVKKEDGDTLYLCPHTDQGCRYKSINKYNFTKHMGTHVDRYSCESCTFTCRKKKQFRQHSESAHGSGVRKNFLCSICGKNFKNSGRLRVHLRIHMNDRPFICDQCGRGFASKDMMTEHQKVKHAGEIFTCQTCGKEFPAKKYLQKHIKTHDPSRIFLCDVCPKAFKTAAHLRTHTRVHTGEKPFQCAECGKRFKQICGLVAHKNAHSGKKSYICTACETGFIYNSSLKNGLCLQCRKAGVTVDTKTVIAERVSGNLSSVSLNFVKMEIGDNNLCNSLACETSADVFTSTVQSSIVNSFL
jgi:uncharacterized Zn-finger protein